MGVLPECLIIMCAHGTHIGQMRASATMELEFIVRSHVNRN